MPWKAEVSQEGFIVRELDKPGFVCEYFPIGDEDMEQVRKNAKLIAAAPDLLEACMSVSAYPGVINADVEAIHAAIRKAVGD